MGLKYNPVTQNKKSTRPSESDLHLMLIFPVTGYFVKPAKSNNFIVAINLELQYYTFKMSFASIMLFIYSFTLKIFLTLYGW